MNNEHIILFYDLRVQVYTDAAVLGISVAAVAEFMLERWWCVWAEAQDTVSQAPTQCREPARIISLDIA